MSKADFEEIYVYLTVKSALPFLRFHVALFNSLRFSKMSNPNN